MDGLLNLWDRFRYTPFEYPPRAHPLPNLIVIGIVAGFVASICFSLLWGDKRRSWRELWMPVGTSFAFGYLVLLVLLPFYYRYGNLPSSFQNGEVGILIAEVPDEPNLARQRAYELAIRDRFQKSARLKDIAKVRMLTRPLPVDLQDQQIEAVKIGRWLNASFVLRPYTIESTQSPELTVVDPGQTFKGESSLGKFPNAQLAYLDHLPLPDNIVLLAEVAEALSLEEEMSPDAADLLGDVLASPELPDAAPGRPMLHYLRGYGLRFAGKPDEAIAEYGKAIDQKPDFALAYDERADTYYIQGDHDRAIADYSAAIHFDPTMTIAYLFRGQSYAGKRQYDRAIADYDEFIRLDPKDAGIYLYRGEAYNLKGQHNYAIADFNRAIQQSPKFEAYYVARGVAYHAMGEYDRAIADYNEAIRLNPKYAGAYNLRGRAYHDKGDNDRAIGDYDEAIRLDPKLVEAYDNRGLAYYNKRESSRAIADCNEAIRLDPKDAVAYNDRGLAYDATGEHDRAFADYNDALRLDPKFMAGYYNRGSAYDDKGEHDRAIADFNEAIHLNPDYAASYYHRGKAYDATGNHDSAIADYKEALRLDPEMEEARQRLQTQPE